ncbi:hypothetical protein ABW20_dc0107069 [Dactylellina cionopaga]|nr:hypothetical protein ABW20_dc0107069 [Dactylellina cionopaga]
MKLFRLVALAVGFAVTPSFSQQAVGLDLDQQTGNCNEKECATSYTETITRGNQVQVLVHPHERTSPLTPEYGDRTEATKRASSSDIRSSSDKSATAVTSTAAPTTPQSLSRSTSSSSPERIALPTPLPPHEFSSSPAETKYSSPVEPPITATTTTFVSTSSPAGAVKTARPLDSSEIQICTGGTYQDCIANYFCDREPTETMRCICRNNVAQGCNEACGRFQNVQPEDCPLQPVSEKPSGLPGPGVGENSEDDGPKVRWLNRGRQNNAEVYRRWRGGVRMLWVWPAWE